MNLSKQLPIQIARIEAAKYRIGKIWRYQSEKKKWVFGLAALLISGLIVAKGQKFAAPGIYYLQKMLSVFVLVSRFIASSGIQKEDEQQ